MHFSYISTALPVKNGSWNVYKLYYQWQCWVNHNNFDIAWLICWFFAMRYVNWLSAKKVYYKEWKHYIVNIVTSSRGSNAIIYSHVTIIKDKFYQIDLCLLKYFYSGFLYIHPTVIHPSPHCLIVCNLLWRKICKRAICTVWIPLPPSPGQEKSCTLGLHPYGLYPQ